MTVTEELVIVFPYSDQMDDSVQVFNLNFVLEGYYGNRRYVLKNNAIEIDRSKDRSALEDSI